ncbi:MAG: hypothetical protein AAFR87_07585 [Bacteroidota bacterium]
MRYIFPIFLGLFFLLACEEGNNNSDPVIEAPLVFLNYDGSNLTAPNLSAGTYEAAAKFTSDETQSLQNGQLTEVYFYLLNTPSSATVKIYRGTDQNFPVELIYSKGVTSSLEANSWNHHILDAPIDITQDDIWIAIRFQTGQQDQIIGCDVGPADINGDWLFENADGNWDRLLRRSNNEANINWNIRGVVDPS